MSEDISAAIGAPFVGGRSKSCVPSMVLLVVTVKIPRRLPARRVSGFWECGHTSCPPTTRRHSRSQPASPRRPLYYPTRPRRCSRRSARHSQEIHREQGELRGGAATHKTDRVLVGGKPEGFEDIRHRVDMDGVIVFTPMADFKKGHAGPVDFKNSLTGLL